MPEPDKTQAALTGGETQPQAPAPAATQPAQGPITVPVSRLTLANKITILRILCIPVFVMFAIYYVNSFERGEGNEWYRLWAIFFFALAAVTDALDGYIARKYSQKSRLGTILDPLADKLLLVSALVLFSIDNGEAFIQLPLWLPVLVISRDLFLLGGSILLQFMHGNFVARPRIVGKLATGFLMITLGWVLLKIESPSFKYPLYAVGFFTLLSVFWYTYDFMKGLIGQPKPTKITRPF